MKTEDVNIATMTGTLRVIPETSEFTRSAALMVPDSIEFDLFLTILTCLNRRLGILLCGIFA